MTAHPCYEKLAVRLMAELREKDAKYLRLLNQHIATLHDLKEARLELNQWRRVARALDAELPNVFSNPAH